MKRGWRVALVAVWVVWLGLGLAHARVDIVFGQVVSVADGDTLTMVTDEGQRIKVRLLAIDAPELKQPFGPPAREALVKLVQDKSVKVVITKLDRYDRSLGKVLLNGQDVNLILVTNGMAWHYRQYEGDQSQEDRLAYARAELEARQANRGLWSQAKPLAPWFFRRGIGSAR
jgi:endonuclease YncB( thermonuclease family)